jgi:hypothetical protein
MTELIPALVVQTKLDNNVVADVKVLVKRTVTYVINIASSNNLSLPYAVAVDGEVREEFKNKPKRVSGRNGEIFIKNVDPGRTVGLFLNSDAHPSHRKNLVYSVTPGDLDVMVKIFERPGKHSEDAIPIKLPVEGSQEKRLDVYSAVLTGDIWMKISYKYSSADVDTLLLPDTSPVVLTAVKRIYDGLAQNFMEISVPAMSGTNARSISIVFDDGNNPSSNINSGYDFLKEGIKRVHPKGYAAIFSAAIDSGIDKIGMTSAWRPMLGSIAHRAGLGIDINYVGATRMNREKLRRSSTFNTANVSLEEKNLFASFELSKSHQSELRKAVEVAEVAVRKAESEPARRIAAKQKLKEAADASVIADKNRKEAEVAWNEERDKHEPEHVRQFRSALIRSKNVAQVFDPWFMDSNTHDNVVATPNLQADENEKLHAHHLHITVYEPKIL